TRSQRAAPHPPEPEDRPVVSRLSRAAIDGASRLLPDAAARPPGPLRNPAFGRRPQARAALTALGRRRRRPRAKQGRAAWNRKYPCRPRASGDPGQLISPSPWIPAFAGLTTSV